MTLYALDDVGDAVDAARGFLWPPDRGTWLRLAVVVFFVGGGTGVGQFGQLGNAAPTNGGGSAPAPSPGSLGSPELAILAAVVALLVVLALGFGFVGAVMEFVFVESLRRETVRLRAYWRTHWRHGARLFGFRLLLGLATLALVALVLGVTVAPILFGIAPVGVVLLLVALPVVLLVALASAVVGGFTTTFVVPTMMLEERGVGSAWRRFWPTLREGWKQYAAYAAVAFALRLGVGLLVTAVTVLGAFVLAIPLGLLGALGVALAGQIAPVGWGIVAIAVVSFVLGLFALSLFAAVPVQTALRYYGLFVLGDTDASLDVVPEQRRAVRA
ncbi:MAG: hypothetical protein ABEJ43_09715 [Haloferacaceae archaeon]